MEINNIHNFYRVNSKALAGKTAHIPTGKTAKIGTPENFHSKVGDSINISSDASFKAQLGKYAKAYKAKNMEKVSPERMAQLKEQYKENNCPISSKNIAAAVIKYTLSTGK